MPLPHVSRWLGWLCGAMAPGVAFQAPTRCSDSVARELDAFTNNWVYTAVEFLAVGGLRRPRAEPARGSARVGG